MRQFLSGARHSSGHRLRSLTLLDSNRHGKNRSNMYSHNRSKLYSKNITKATSAADV